MLDEDESRVLNGYSETDKGELILFCFFWTFVALFGHFLSKTLIFSEMTIQKCLSICRSKKFQFASLEWSMECYCGNEPENGFKWAWPGKCNSRCGGNLEQVCGGSRAMSVYSVATDGICIMDFPNNRRVLDRYSITGDDNMTIELCRDICAEKSTRYYGVENGDECYCGDNDEGKDIRKSKF